MAQDVTTRLIEAMLELRRDRIVRLPPAMFAGDQPFDLLLVLFVADARSEHLSGREAMRRCGGSAQTGARWMKYLTAEGLIVGDGEGNLDDVIALTPKALCAIEDYAHGVNDRLSPVYTSDRRR